ncbi:MAG: restriction endonuclease subunit S [Thermoplasmatales archaeon]|nr:restriction endonuclease subunit S [Thermoplasmatales archaeon]
MDWHFKKLKEIAVIKGRIGWKGLKRSEFSKQGVLIINGPNIIDGRVDWQNCLRIPFWRYQESMEISVKVSDILVTKDGTIGKTAYIKSLREPATLASGIFLIRSQETQILIQDFLYQYFKSPLFRKFVVSRTEGSVIPHLYQRDIEDLVVPVPPLLEQKAIAKILSDIDSKIELNTQMNRTLEAIAQAIFKRWFIHFEFPNENGEPYKSSGGEMVDSELGEIPKGWEVKKSGNFMTLDKGLSYKGKFLSDSGMPLINLGCVLPGGGFISNGLKYYIGDYNTRHIVRAGDIVLANTDITQRRGILGSPVIVPEEFNDSKAIFTHHLYAIRLSNEKLRFFIYQLLKTKKYKEKIISFATGTTVLNIPKDSVLEYPFAFPREVILNTFNVFLTNLLEKMERNNKLNRDLVQVRDSLIPKLMSGKIRVPLEEVK